SGEAAGGVDLVVVAVKPAMAADALRALPADWLGQAVVVSVAAGVTVATLEAVLPLGTPVIRVMPNTPAMLRAGCTGLYAAPGVDEARREQVGALFATVGSAHWVDQESHIDLVTAISGSGPAYYHLFSEALAQAGVALGLAPELARALAADTAWGAAALQHQPDAD
ncbi:pyrroline-5-carboxylate reductase dimerization domain-containing protein, partial [Pseudacidovorax intermedius]|uniref:pyrroline-5-carboxylate reductase dimerization domain-containing protein n=1 Tax=Pseudacidovorax intermedius TaxID=433924 RepID=UPI0005BAE174